jgi:hypothetical protein
MLELGERRNLGTDVKATNLNASNALWENNKAVH